VHRRKRLCVLQRTCCKICNTHSSNRHTAINTSTNNIPSWLLLLRSRIRQECVRTKFNVRNEIMIYLKFEYCFSEGCHLAEGIWCGIFVGITSLFGVYAIRNGTVRWRCLFMAYFVMNILMCIVVFVHGFITFVWSLSSIGSAFGVSNEFNAFRCVSIIINLILLAMAIAMCKGNTLCLFIVSCFYISCVSNRCIGVHVYNMERMLLWRQLMTSRTVVYLHTTDNDDGVKASD
jgi:hypothetical protein